MNTLSGLPTKRHLPKLMACMTKRSLEQFRGKTLYASQFLDWNGVRRLKSPLHECLIAELKEGGFVDSSSFLEDLIYDNIQLVDQDDIGIVVDLREREDYLKHIAEILQQSETQREKDDIKKECLLLLNMAMTYSEKEKGILWLAEKLFITAIAISSQYLLDGGRLKAVCKYYYGKFLLDKFPGADTEEANSLLTQVRNSSIGKGWPLYEAEEEGEEVPPDTVFTSSALLLLRVLLEHARAVRKVDVSKAERLARLAERRAKDAEATDKIAEAITEIGICQLMMNNLNNAQKTFERALKIHEDSQNIEGLCEVRMHLAAVMLRLGDHETALKLLTQMGASAIEYGLRRELGLALHLIGELHLRREKPELGTPHLAEAFLCFMGFQFDEELNADFTEFWVKDHADTDISTIYREPMEVYEEDAEQSRLMTAISAGQELMASYFNLLKEAGECTVAKIKTIEWKLSHSGWWIRKVHHKYLPCTCPVHHRTPLDAMRKQMDNKKAQSSSLVLGPEWPSRKSEIHDIRLQSSSYAMRTMKSEISRRPPF